MRLVRHPAFFLRSCRFSRSDATEMTQGESRMLTEKSRIGASTIIGSIGILIGIAGVALGAGAFDRGRAIDDRPRWQDRRPLPTLSQRMTMMDEAISARDLTRAGREWRDAFALALASRRWEAMVDMGDAAVKIAGVDGDAGGSRSDFRAQARQAYLRALFQARNQRAYAGIERVATAFAALGDTDVASRARALAATPR